jgi:hypothetical protein
MKAFLVKVLWDGCPFDLVVFAKTERGAKGKIKRKYNSEITSLKLINYI